MALIGRFPAIWIVWIILLNISLTLYHLTFRGAFFIVHSDTDMLWLVFIFNTFVLVIWEYSTKIWHWLAERWAIRLLALGSGVPITFLAIQAIFDKGGFISGAVWSIWLTAIYFIYRKVKIDLFMLAGGCLSGISVIVSYLGKHLFEYNHAGGYLLVSLLIITMGAGSALWLKNIYQEIQS